MLRYVPIVNISCNLYIYSKKKKKKKKKKKNDPYLGMGKNTKVMPQMPHYLSFLLGKGGNPYISNPIKKLITSALSDLPPACNELGKASMNDLKIAQNMYIFLCKFHTFPVTEGNEIWHIYSSL